MAGFAVFMTILTWSFFSLVGAGVASLFLYFAAKQGIAREVPRRRRSAMRIAAAPFVALMWLVAALMTHVFICNYLAHQDCGLIGDPYVRLPNGYVLGSNNTYDGFITAPGYETDVPTEGPGYVRSIIDLQLENGVFRGTQFDLKTSKMRNFVFDTANRRFQASEQAASDKPISDLDAWGTAMTSAQHDQNSYWKMYERYRHHWPNYVLTVLILIGEASTFLWARKNWILNTTNIEA